MLVGNKKETDYSILEYAQNYYKKAIVDNNKLAIGTKKNYLKALKHFQNFVTVTKATSKPLEEINVAFAAAFLDYLMNDNAELNRKGMTDVSACGLVKKMRTIYERAFKEELIMRNPFKEIKVRNRSPFRQKMNISEISKWYQYDLNAFPTQDIYRDIYFFSFLTGLAYSDIATLSHSHLLPIESGELLLKKARQKTNEIIEVVLVSYARNIIEKYRHHPDKKQPQLVFPCRSLNSANIYNRILADRMGITTKVTTHIARHTFRQLLPEAGVQDHMVIKRMMGQSANGDIDSVYYQVTESALVQAKEKFQAYLDKHFK
jgi:site-specific recombinase XerD